MPDADAEYFEVDFSRAKDGFRRYWWLCIVFGLISLTISGSITSQATAAEAELRFSANRSRLTSVLQVLDPAGVALRYSTADFENEVELRTGTRITFTVSITEKGNLSVSAQGANKAEAFENLDLVIDVLNEVLREEEVELGVDQQQILERTIAEFENSISEVRSDHNSDQVSEIIERSSLVGLLASQQLALASLNSELAVDVSSLDEIRRGSQAASGISRPALSLVGGIAVGGAIAVLLGFIRRRVSDKDDLRRITKSARILTTSDGATEADRVALALGILRLRNGTRESVSLYSTGEQSRTVASTIVAAAQSAQLPLTLAEDGPAEGHAVALVETASGLDALLRLPDDVTIIAAARRGERLDDVSAMADRIAAAGYQLGAALLIS